MEETLINRTMPNSREAEQSVIGSMIMDKDAILTAMEMLISEDFITNSMESCLIPWSNYTAKDFRSILSLCRTN